MPRNRILTHAIMAGILIVGPVVGAAELVGTQPFFPDSVSVFIGYRHLEQGPWSEVQTPVQLGVMAGWSQWAGPGELVVGIAEARGSGIIQEPADGVINVPFLGAMDRSPTKGQVDITVWEVQIGLRQRWRVSWWELSLAGGPEMIQVSIERTPGVTVLQSISTLNTPASTRSGQVWAPGAWASAGVAMLLGRSSLGIEGRYSFAHAEVLDESASLGGWQLGAVFGMSW